MRRTLACGVGRSWGVEGGRKFMMEVWYVLAGFFFRYSGLGARLGVRVGREGGGEYHHHHRHPS